MNTLDEEMLETRNFFLKHHITLSDFWLENCVKWLREQTSYTPATLHTQVYEQWLLLDLRDVEVQILPTDIHNSKKVDLPDQYSLQLLSVVDISVSKLSQLNKIRNKNSKLSNPEEDYNAPKGKRTLLLTLTDGVQEIQALEYAPIRQLNINLTPGMKIRVVGPVTVRRGRMIIKEENIKLLGGEVEELLISNAAENILAANLNLPLNQNPNNIEIIEEIRNETGRNSNQRTQQHNINHQSNVNRQTNDISANRPTNTDQGYVNHQVDIKDEDLNLDVDDELLLAVDITEQQVEPSTSKERSITPDFFEDMDVDLDAIDKIENTAIESKKSSNTIADTNKPSTPIKTEKPVKKQILVCEIENLVSSITKGKFSVHVRFNSILEKLSVTNDSWHIKVLVEDDTGQFGMFINSDVVSELIGYCPSVLMTLKKNIANKDPCTVKTIMKALTGFKEQLTKLDCLIEILIEKNSVPIITKINP